MVAATEGSEVDLLRLVNRLKIPAVNNHTKAVWNTPLDIGDHYVAFHAPANVTATRARTVQVFEKLGPRATSSILKAFSAIRSKRNGIKLAARRPGGWSRTTTASVIADILTAHPDIDAVIVSNDDSAIAVVSALEQRKMKALVSDRDAIKEMVALVAQGKAFNTHAYGPSRREALRRTLLERSRAGPSRPDEQQGSNRHLPILSRPHLRKPPSAASSTSRESARLSPESRRLPR
jgi:ribose transport system substrate-binding protein